MPSWSAHRRHRQRADVRSYTCPFCPFNDYPGFVLGNDGRLIVECPKCQLQNPSLTPADFNQTIAAIASDGAPSEPGWTGKRAVHANDPALEIVQPAPPRQAPQPSAMPQAYAAPTARNPGDIVAWVEERRAWLATEEARIEGEIASRRACIAGLRTERRRLDKMSRAARSVRDDGATQELPGMSTPRMN